MPFTGERFCPHVRGEVALEHFSRYALAAELARGKDVLDIASGEGYGSRLMADYARTVTGVELDWQAVCHAAKTYAGDNLAFVQGNAAKIPLADNSVDLVASFETIEHHDQHESMLAEICRVLRPDGVLMLSSPEKALNEYRNTPNKYHVAELYREELEHLLARHFARYALYGQRTVFASIIDGTNGQRQIWPRDAPPRPQNALTRITFPHYHVALATNGKTLPELPLAIMEGRLEDSEAFCAARSHIDGLRSDLAARKSDAEAMQASLAETRKYLEAARTENDSLARELEATRASNAELERQLGIATGDLARLLNSRSWKLTAPLRAIMAKARQKT